MHFFFIGENSYQFQQLMKKLELKYFIAEIFEQVTPKPSMKQLREARPRIEKLMEIHHKSMVVGLGSLALKLILDRGSKGNIAHYRGRKLQWAGINRVCYVTYDPNSIKTTFENYKLILEDLFRFDLPKTKWPVNKKPKLNHTIGIDTEYAPDNTCLDIGLANINTAYRIGPNNKQDLIPFYKTPVLIGHAVAGDFSQLVKLGCHRNDWAQGLAVKDSFLITRLIDENRGKGNYSVEALFLSKHNCEGWKHKTEEYSKHDATQWPSELRQERCRLDAWSSVHIVNDWYTPTIQKSLVLQQRIAMTLERIQLAGAYVDYQAFQHWAIKVKLEHMKQLSLLTQIAQKYGMQVFSPTKPDDVRKLLFTKMKLPIEERTATNLPAITKSWLSRHQHIIPEVKQVLTFRQLDKLLTTYVIGIEKKMKVVDSDKIIPFRLMAMGTRTGRRAADRPNSQNWPKSARVIIKSRWKEGMILSNDFKKLEIIILAFEAGDEELMDYFTKEENGYISIGSKLFGKTVKEDTPEYRQVKALILGVNYNLQAYGLAKQLWDLHNIRLAPNFDDHVIEVDALRKRYLRMFPRIQAYQKERIYDFRASGNIYCWFDHVRHLPTPPKPHNASLTEFKQWRKIMAHTENEAINVVIQNAASYVTGTAMLDCESAIFAAYGYKHIDVHKALVEGRSKELNMPLLINEVHDDLVFDCPKKEVKKAQKIINNCMTELVTLRKLVPEFDAPVRVHQTASTHWGKNDS